MKVYITAYALTRGILVAEGSISDNTPSMIITKSSCGYPTYYHSDDWHKTLESAIKRADEMRLAKIKLLQRQLSHLENITNFKVVEQK